MARFLILAAVDSWEVAAVVLALLAILVAAGVQWRQERKQRRSLGYEVSDRTLVHVGREARDKVQVLYQGAEVSGVRLIQAVVRNTGRVPIPRADFDRPIVLRPSAGIEFLPSTLTVVGDPVGMRPDASATEGTIEIQPVLLNPGDRLTIGILGSGSFADQTVDQAVDVDLRVAGVPEVVQTIDRPEQASVGRRLLLNVGAAASVAALAALIVPLAIHRLVPSNGSPTVPDVDDIGYRQILLRSGGSVCAAVARTNSGDYIILRKGTSQSQVLHAPSVQRVGSKC